MIFFCINFDLIASGGLTYLIFEHRWRVEELQDGTGKRPLQFLVIKPRAPWMLHSRCKTIFFFEPTSKCIFLIEKNCIHIYEYLYIIIEDVFQMCIFIERQ